MLRFVRTFGLVVTACLVAYAGWLLLFDADADDVVAGALADARGDDDPRAEVVEHRERLEQVARGMALAPGRAAREAQALAEEEEPPAPVVPYGSGELDLEGVRSGFSYAMDRVDKVVKSRKRLDQAQWATLYRETNDAFSALSIMLDASDETQAAELEAAHKQLKQKLRRVRVRGRKFGT